MEILTLQVALSSLSFIYKSQTILPKIETINEFENAWNANLDLAVAMSKDTRIAESLNATDWKNLQAVSTYLNRNNSPLVLFSVLEEVLQIPTVEAIINLYQEYPTAVIATRDLAITVTEDFRLHRMTGEKWKRLLATTRMRIPLINNLECQNTANITVCEEQVKPNYLKLVNTNINELRNAFRDLVPTTMESARGFLQMGYLLELPFLASRSSKFLEESLSMENVISIYEVSTKTEQEHLKRKSEQYIFWEFEEISKNSKTFLYLKVDELFSLLSGKVHVYNESSIFEAIERWVMADRASREKHVTTLMETVRLHLCSLSFLERILNHDLLISLEPVQESIQSAIYLKQTNSSKLEGFVKKEQSNLGESLFVFGGRSTPKGSSVETFSISKQQWRYHEGLDIRINLSSRKSAVAVGQTIVVLDHNLFEVSSFDPIQKDWKILSIMPNKRSYFGVSELNGLIYVLGGYTDEASSICETFDPKTGIWTEIPNLIAPKYYLRAATLQGQIYLVGGYDGSTHLRNVEVFNPERSSWTVTTPLNQARADLSLLAEDGYLWAFGGDSGTELSSVERYDPEIETWIYMPQMPIPRNHLEVVYFSGQFFVIGAGNTAVNARVDVYNPRRRTWSRTSDLHYGRDLPAVCVIRNLPNAQDYI